MSFRCKQHGALGCDQCDHEIHPNSLQIAQAMVLEFHRKFGCTIGNTIAVRDAHLRRRLINEEARETIEALGECDIVETIDGLCDLIYVAAGTAVAMGVDLWPVFLEVHRSNMTKTADNKRADGKIAKGPEYSPPDIEGCLRAQGWKP